MATPTNGISVLLVGAALYLMTGAVSACAIFSAISVPSDFSLGWTFAAFIELFQLLVCLPLGTLGVGVSVYALLQIARTKQIWQLPCLRTEE